MKNFFKNKTIILVLVLIVWLFPIAISLPEQSRTESIVIAVGIDKTQNEYEVSLQYLIPHAATRDKSLEISGVKAESVEKAFEKLYWNLGKFSGFAHCRAIVFNDDVATENLTFVLDSFLRQKTNTNNAVLINTSDSAKELLQTSNSLNSNLYSFLNNSAFSNEYKGYEDLKSVGDFYNAYFGISKCLCINVLGLEKDDTKQSSEQSSSSGDSGGSPSSKPDKKMVNNRELAIIKNSKKLLTLSTEESKNLNLFNNNITKCTLEITDFSDENFKNASFLFNIFNKKINTKVYFKNNVPTIDYNIKVYLRTSQVLSNNLMQSDYQIQQQRFSIALQERIKQEITNKLKLAEQNFKQNCYDVINCEEMFYKFCCNQYKNYKKSINNQDFITGVKFNYSVEIVKGVQ